MLSHGNGNAKTVLLIKLMDEHRDTSKISARVGGVAFSRGDDVLRMHQCEGTRDRDASSDADGVVHARGATGGLGSIFGGGGDGKVSGWLFRA